MVAETAKKTVAQVERAAEVVRSLRALVRLDNSNRASYSVERICKKTIALCRPELDKIHASARAVSASDLPPVIVDILQVEQALLNLLHNSIEAIDEAKISKVPSRSKRRLPAQTSLRLGSVITARDSHLICSKTRFFRFPRLRPKVLASDCHYANR